MATSTKKKPAAKAETAPPKATIQKADRPTGPAKMNVFQFVRGADWDGKHYDEGDVVEVSNGRLDAEVALGTHDINKDSGGKPKPLSGLLNHAEMIEEA